MFADWYTLSFSPMAAKDGTLYAVYYTFNPISHSPDRPAIRKYETCSDSWDFLAGATVAGGPAGNINAMVVSGDYLFVGGYFETIGGIWATNIAKYQFSTGTWSPVGDGSLTNKPIVAITLPFENPDNVYVALQVGPEEDSNTPVDAEMVKRWNGVQWETVGQGLLAHWNGVGDAYNVSVSAMTTDGTNIYVAGYFNGAISANGDSVGSRNLIKWNPGSGQWEQEAITCTVTEGGTVICFSESAPAANVYAMATKQDPTLGTFIMEAGAFWDDPTRCCDHYPGRGIFAQLDGTYGNSSTYLGYLSQYCGQPYYGQGLSLAKFGGNLYLSGYFESFGCVTSAGSVGQIAAGNNYWEPLGDPSALTVNSSPSLPTLDQITADQFAVYVRGTIDNVEGAQCLSGLARYPLRPYTSGPCQGKIGWWRMEGNAVDSAMGHNSDIVDSFAFSTGKYGQGVHTSVKAGGLSVANTSALNFGAGADFTLEAWVKPEVATTSYDILNILDKRVVSGTVAGYELALSGGKIIFQMASTSGQMLNAGPTGNDLRDGNWHHVAVTVQRGSSTGGKFYVDGVQVGTSFDTTSVSGDLTSTASLLIAMHPDPYLDCNFRGDIDEPGVYSRALTASEISGIYTSGKSTGSPANAVAWWPLEGDGTDLVGGHNGVVVDSFEFQPDQSGQYIQLNSKAGGLNVSDSADLNFGTSGDFTIEAWVKPQTASTSYGVMDIVDKRVTGGTVVGYELALSNGQLVFQMASGTILSAGPTGSDLRNGSWHHVAVTVQRNSATGGKLYVDGSQVGSSFNPTIISGSLTSTAALLIGMHPDTSLDCNFRGGIDEVVMYSRAISSTEVQSAFSAGPP